MDDSSLSLGGWAGLTTDFDIGRARGYRPYHPRSSVFIGSCLSPFRVFGRAQGIAPTVSRLGFGRLAGTDH